MIPQEAYCTSCGSQAPLVGIEVWGAYDGVLFWTCADCDHATPRFTGPAHDPRTRRSIQAAHAHNQRR